MSEVHNLLKERDELRQKVNSLTATNAELKGERDGLRAWVHDLQSGMYINCVYCGHRYGPDDEVPASMADALKEHIKDCPEHPLKKCKAACDAALKWATTDMDAMGGDFSYFAETVVPMLDDAVNQF